MKTRFAKPKSSLRNINWARVNWWGFMLWLTLGAGVSYLLRDVLPWTNFMSWYAIIGMHLTAWRADMPNPKTETSE